MTAAPPRRRPMQAAPLASPSVVVDTLSAELQQATTEYGIHAAVCRWRRQSLICSTCQRTQSRLQDAQERLARAIERERR